MDNPFIESFNDCFRECLNVNWFLSLLDCVAFPAKYVVQVVPHLNTARPCRSMICEAFLRLVDSSVDGFGGGLHFLEWMRYKENLQNIFDLIVSVFDISPTSINIHHLITTMQHYNSIIMCIEQ